MTEELVTRNPENFFTQLWSLKNQELFCDATIIVNGERINVHANVLASSSEYLKNWFSESAIKEITFKDVDKEVLLLLIQYCYTGKIIVSEKNAEEIFKMAKILSIMSIFDSSSSILEKILNVSNCLSIWKIARMGNLQQLEIKAFDFAKNNFEKVSRTDGFLILEFEEAREILKSEKVIASELSAYRAIKNWVDHDESRKTFLSDLLDLAKLESLSQNLLVSESLTLCDFDVSCFKKINTAIQVQNLAPCEESDFIGENNIKCTLVAVGSTDFTTVKKMEIYDVIKEQWVETKEININRIYFSAAIINNTVLLIGGRINENVSVNTVEGYDLRTGRLETLPSMHYARRLLTTVEYMGYMFAIGGLNEKSVPHVEMFDPHSKKWTKSTPMIEARYGCSACVLKNEIFVVGGFTDTQTNSVEAYNFFTDKWRKIAPLTQTREGAGVAVIGEYLYVVGGWANTNSGERYDPKNNNWTTIQKTGIQRKYPGTAIFGRKLVVAGGSDDDTGLTVEIYDEKTDTWEFMAPMKNRRWYFNLIEVPIHLAKVALSNK